MNREKSNFCNVAKFFTWLNTLYHRIIKPIIKFFIPIKDYFVTKPPADSIALSDGIGMKNLQFDPKWVYLIKIENKKYFPWLFTL